MERQGVSVRRTVHLTVYPPTRTVSLPSSISLVISSNHSSAIAVIDAKALDCYNPLTGAALRLAIQFDDNIVQSFLAGLLEWSHGYSHMQN